MAAIRVVGVRGDPCGAMLWVFSVHSGVQRVLCWVFSVHSGV